ncbi:Carotenoid cis-trans isomerase [Winogradskyella psychrotolerans RS-3]|uniref:Carotenoid cis-trans isomerase n=1 Tax=Winogradskyella psychrotolerans RS-3 TaxID=641526 RepID=S7VID9_9FLAO|nr:NAD(P)/FAD-dependent oxidoreductase [Winogradskyella psychrotolerans]EPR70010.1 Carotenoid cis-trans isomerase [Winogradskyella psychrotolerans RS-3]
MKSHYDVVIIGSGLGGLVSANILAKEGYSVCVLEKNNQYGGNLQTFVRDKTIFDTGVHYIGGLNKGQNLYQYFKYLDIIDDLNLKKLDEDGFDVITFDNDNREYKHAQGYDRFIKNLLVEFPDEEKAIITYCDKLKEICDQFPLYGLKYGKPYYEKTDIFSLKAKDYIDSITDNKKLQAVLAGTNYLYAGDADRTPFYVHALTINSYIESAYRCVNGGSQISKLLIRRLKENGGDAFNHHEVVKFGFEDKNISSVFTKNGKEIKADLFISNIEPKLTIKLVGEDKFRKVYTKRINNIESIIAGFSLYIVLKPNTFKYQNKNIYHIKDPNRIWDGQDYTAETWPEGYMASMGINKKTDKYGESLTVMTYMRYEEVEAWENTFNTVANKNDRGQTYEEFKAEKAEILIQELEKKYPTIRDCIQEIYTSTPLSYRDYIGSHRGSIYGYVKDANNPLASFVSPKTKIKNLLLTGQSLNMHGILGVTIGAVLTCSEIVGMEPLLKKILDANKTEESIEN